MVGCKFMNKKRLLYPVLFMAFLFPTIKIPYYAVCTGIIFEHKSKKPLSNVQLDFYLISKKNDKNKSHICKCETDSEGRYIANLRYLSIHSGWKKIAVESEISIGVKLYLKKKGYKDSYEDITVEFKSVNLKRRHPKDWNSKEFIEWESKHIFEERKNEIPITKFEPTYLAKK